MATKNFAYDHPAYLVPVNANGVIAAAASSQFKFPVWTTMVLKSTQISSLVAGTGAATDAFVLQRVQLDATLGTATTSLAALTTNTAAMFSKNIQGTYTFTQGEFICVTKGTDGTSQYAISFELFVAPGANVTG
jgi:hypothetical protein